MPDFAADERGEHPRIDERQTSSLIVGPRETANKDGTFFSLGSYPVRRLITNPLNPGRGQLGNEEKLEVFERGDSVGVLLYNRKKHEIVLVRQFRLPTVTPRFGTSSAPPTDDGWIIETVAGMTGEVTNADGSKRWESPEETAIRETFEETGYVISRPELIATYFSSPGGTSERIFLYFAVVSDEAGNRPEPGGGKFDERTGKWTEDIEVVNLSVDEFARKVRAREFVDPKLLISAYYLQNRLGVDLDSKTEIKGNRAPASRFEWAKRRDIAVEFKFGDILNVTDVDVWLNPENKHMLMARVIDASLSASIRWGGAEKYSAGAIASDSVGDALRAKMKGRHSVDDVEIMETTPGSLALAPNRVRRLLHLPVSEARGELGARMGLKVNRDKIRQIVRTALEKIDNDNKSPGQILARMLRYVFPFGKFGQPCETVLLPMIGADHGQLAAASVIPLIIDGITDFLEARGAQTEIKTLYLLAYYDGEVEDCLRELRAKNDRFVEVPPDRGTALASAGTSAVTA